MATIMGKDNIYISTDYIGLYEKDIRMEKGGKWKAEVVAALLFLWNLA